MELAHDPQTQKLEALMPDGSTPALTSVTFLLPRDATDQVCVYALCEHVRVLPSSKANFYGAK